MYKRLDVHCQTKNAYLIYVFKAEDSGSQRQSLSMNVTVLVDIWQSFLPKLVKACLNKGMLTQAFVVKYGICAFEWQICQLVQPLVPCLVPYSCAVCISTGAVAEGRNFCDI